MKNYQNIFKIKCLLTETSFALICLWTFMSGEVKAVTISATASGSLNPPNALFPAEVMNGDFRIIGNETNPNVGDGQNEETFWTFDFTEDPNFFTFPTLESLSSAELTLTLTPRNPNIITDAVNIIGLPLVQSDIIQSLPLNETNTVSLDLLDFYTSNEILDTFSSDLIPPSLNKAPGTLPLKYGGDAIVSFAQLDLTADETPSPSSIPEPNLLFALLTLGSLSFFQRGNFRAS